MALLALTLALLPMTVATTTIMTKPLDMALNSFDDQYQGCGPAMEAVLPALNRSEFQQNSVFAKAWSKAVVEWQSEGSPVFPLSSSAQAIAIRAYPVPDLYDYFNIYMNGMGHSPQAYRDNFHFKTLHFLLTKAVATLKAAQNGQKCQGVIHADLKYKLYANPGDIVRFGRFALSYGPIDGIQSLDEPTVFKVQTCHGAEINAFSGKTNTKVVLIPPYEKFKVIGVLDYGERVEIYLDSIGTYSKYNCEWLRGRSVPRAPFHIGGLLLATTALAVATGIL